VVTACWETFIYLFYLFISTGAMTTAHDNQSEKHWQKQLPCNKWWTRPNKKHLLLPI